MYNKLKFGQGVCYRTNKKGDVDVLDTTPSHAMSEVDFILESTKPKVMRVGESTIVTNVLPKGKKGEETFWGKYLCNTSKDGLSTVKMNPGLEDAFYLEFGVSIR